MGVFSFKVEGLCCGEECAILKRELGGLVGGEQQLVFDLLDKRMTIVDPPPGLAAAAVQERVARTGMRAVPWEQRSQAQPASFSRQQRQTIVAGFSAALLSAGFIWHWAAHGSLLHALQGGAASAARGYPPASIVLYALAALAGGWFVFPRAWLALKRLRPDMHLLMTVAAGGAALLGDWFEAATVTFLFGVSLALETWSAGRARRAVQGLLQLTPPQARLIQQAGEVLIAPELAPIGARIAIRPGERLPLDGVVCSGSSAVNQAPLTGESIPVFVEPGSTVLAGTVNGSGALVVEVTKRAGDAVIAHMIRLVEEARNKRAPAELWVDWFAVRYTPLVLGLALLLMLLPALITGAWAEWFYRGLVLLVIACPCALVISTPVSIVAALACAARHGVLVKGGAYLELCGRIKAAALDKTGTLTEGHPRLATIIPLNGHSADELLRIGAAIESRSEHPLAGAVVRAALERGIKPPPAESYFALPGLGAEAMLDGAVHWIGSPRFMQARLPEAGAALEQIAALAAQGQSVIAVGTAEHVCGLFGLADSIRPAARAALQGLRQAGVAHIAMLTGDNAATAMSVASTLDLDSIQAGLLPADKVAQVEQLRQTYGTVLLVGDGVNDAPALAAASVGVAMGAAGSDVALETADVALMGDDLLQLPWLIRHSRRTMAIIRQNIAFAIGVKLLFFLLAATGHASLWAAILADMGTSLLVIANALRLLQAGK